MLESLNIEDNEYLPLTFQVYQNYPNPFNPTTSVSYQLPDDGKVEVVIYNMMGELIKNLVDEKQNSGRNSIIWNATNNDGNQVSAGLYICTVRTSDHKQSKKMLLVK